MNYYERMQDSINYIEEHLQDVIDCDEVICRTYYSKTHFYRIFDAMVGMSIGEYIRKRRISNAAYEICTTEKRIIDIGCDFGFESQEVFTRAFIREYGISPGRFRKQRKNAVLFDKIDLIREWQKKANRLLDFELQIAVRTEFSVMGLERIVKPGSSAIGEYWAEFLERKKDIAAANTDVVYGICEYAPNITNYDDFKYLFAVEIVGNNQKAEDLVIRKIPAAIYAKIVHDEKKRPLNETYRLFYGVWLPGSGYELEPQDTIEIYGLHPNKIELWIPIVPGGRGCWHKI